MTVSNQSGFCILQPFLGFHTPKLILLLLMKTSLMPTFQTKTIELKSFEWYLMNPCGNMEATITKHAYYHPRREVIYQELLHASILTKMFASALKSSNDLSECNGVALETLPVIPQFSSLSEEALRSMFKALAYHIAHLHIVNADRNSYCFNQTPNNKFLNLQYQLRYLQCIILKSFKHPNLEEIFQELMKKRAYSYSECSAKQTRGCLVLKQTTKLLEKIVSRLENDVDSFIQTNQVNLTL